MHMQVSFNQESFHDEYTTDNQIVKRSRVLHFSAFISSFTAYSAFQILIVSTIYVERFPLYGPLQHRKSL